MKAKRKISLALAALLLFGLFAGCAPKDPLKAPPESPPSGEQELPGEEKAPENIGNFTFTKENYPKMGGSLACLPLGEAVTAAALSIPRGEAGNYIIFDGSTTSNYTRLCDETFDLILAYEPSEEAKEMVKSFNIELEMTPIGKDSLVFIASGENPVGSLTKDEVRGIYSGKITNWKEVGGGDHEILAYQRNPDSGSQTLFDKLVMPREELMKPPSEQIVGSMIGLLEGVAEYENSEDALGYTVYYYLTNMEDEKLKSTKILAIDGVSPSNETIRSGEYPYSNNFYAVIRKDLPKEHPARILYNWICSAQGKALAERENYVTIE